MKKLSFLFLLCLYIFNGAGAQEKWDRDNCIYTDHDLDFHWALPKELEWEMVKPSAKSTVFKADSPYGIGVFVTVNPYDAREVPPDMWDGFEQYKQIYTYSQAKLEETTGVEVISIEIKKVEFAGERAIKLVTENIYKNNVKEKDIIGITYNFHRGNAIWSVSLKSTPEIYKVLEEEGLKTIFAGFGINASSQDSGKTDKSVAEIKKELEESFIEFCQQFNRQLPMTVDEITTLKSVHFVNWTLAYYYQVDIDREDFEEDVRKQIMENMREYTKSQIPELLLVYGVNQDEICEYLKVTGLKFRFVYQDINGRFIGVLKVDYKDFESKDRESEDNSHLQMWINI